MLQIALLFLNFCNVFWVCYEFYQYLGPINKFTFLLQRVKIFDKYSIKSSKIFVKN